MFEAPTAQKLSRDLRAAVRAEVPGSDPHIWPNNLYVVCKTFAMALRGAYLRLQWVHRQIFASTAEGIYLERHGADLGIRRLAAAFATGEADSTTVVSTSVPDGTRLVRSDGAVYVTVGDVVATGTTTKLTLRAVEVGREGNATPGTPLTPETPVAGLSAVEVDALGLSGGADEENDSGLRQRILLRKQNPPHGGSPTEYVAWARDFPGVTRAYVKRATPQPGSVTVIFLMDDTYTGGIPLPGDVAALREHLRAQAPGSSHVVVRAPIAVPVDIQVQIVPDTARTRDAVRQEIHAMFRRRAEPGLAGEPSTFSRSWISEAISMAAGETRHALAQPASDIVCEEDSAGNSEIAIPGAITFT